MAKVENAMLRSALNGSFEEHVRGIFARILPICMEGLQPKTRQFQEPDYVAGLVKNIPTMLKGKLLPGLSISGCYVHQSPYVSFHHDAEDRCCEVGDLLILYRERLGESQRFNSVLFQFKRADVDKIDENQFMLYSKWPTFNFGKKVYSNQEMYDVMPKSNTAGALYNYIHTGTQLRFTIANPHRCVIDGGVDVRNGIPFEVYLGEFLSWRVGREISSYDKHPGEKNDDQWSHLIWDIVEKTFDSYFARRNIGIEREYRGFGERLNLLMSNVFMEVPDSEQTSANSNDAGSAEFDGACSILLIDTHKELMPNFEI